DVVNRNRDTRRADKQIQRCDFRQQLAVNDRHVAQSAYAADNTISANQCREQLPGQLAKGSSVLDRAEIGQETGATLERSPIQVRGLPECHHALAEPTTTRATGLLLKKRVRGGIADR